MNCVYITNITPLLKPDVYKYYYDKTDINRQQKADKLILPIDKARSIGLGALLRFAIEDSTDYKYENLSFKTMENGKPYIEGNPFYFSLSHSGDYAVCAISDTPVGIDIELDKELSTLVKKRFAENMLEWTKREAKGKLTGNGFFDKTEDTFIYSHKETDGYIITVCSDKKFDNFYTYHLPFPC
ncbi:MAG: hypothetical protein E7574_04045 [Ruminococcaceae bacterium]|nr:hypothetical protein [Oscillospiraceae bacterium]